MSIADRPFKMAEDGDGKIWVTYWCGPLHPTAPPGEVARADGYVARISPGSARHKPNHAHGDFIKVGHFPTGIAYGVPFSEGRHFKSIFVANFDSHTISVLNANTGINRDNWGFNSPYPIMNNGAPLENPSAVAFDGRHLWVAFDPAPVTAQYPDYSLVKCDPMNGNVIARLNNGAGYNVNPGVFGCPTALLYVGPGDGTGDIWVSNSAFPGPPNPLGAPYTVLRFNAEDATLIKSYTVGIQPSELLWDGTYVWVANSGNPPGSQGSVSYINPATNAVNTLPLPVADTRPNGLALGESGGHRCVYVTDTALNNIFTIYVDVAPPAFDPNPVLVGAGAGPFGIRQKNGHLFVAKFKEMNAGNTDADGFTSTKVHIHP